MRAKSQSVIDRQNAKAVERSAALAERLAQITAVAPYADPADLKFLALNCGTTPTFGTIVRVLGAVNAGVSR